MKKKKVYLAKIDIISSEEVTPEIKSKIGRGIFSAELSSEYFKKIIENPTEENSEGIYDIYHITPGSIIRSSDERYYTAYLLKESSVKVGKIDENTRIKDEKRAENDQGLLFTINILDGIVAHYAVNRFRNNQFNRALTFILNEGLKKIGILDVEVKVTGIRDNKKMENVMNELRKIENVKELILEYSLNKNSKSYIELSKISNHVFNSKIKSSYGKGINFSEHAVVERIEEVMKIHNVICNIEDSEGVNVGKVLIFGESMDGKTFSIEGNKNITYEINENDCKFSKFIDKSKDIIENYMLSY